MNEFNIYACCVCVFKYIKNNNKKKKTLIKNF